MNAKSKSVLFVKEKYPLEVFILEISDWSGFDKLIQFLKNEYAIEVIENYDGPGSRRWVLKSEGRKFELWHEDSFGNSLVALDPKSVDIVSRIGEDLNARLSKS